MAAEVANDALDDAEDTTVSFDTAIDMLRKRAREDSEESEDEAEQSVIVQMDGNDDSVEADEDDHYSWSCSICDEMGESMKAVMEHRNQCRIDKTKPYFDRAQFWFYPR